MTRRVVYGASLWAFIAAIGMTLAANIIPEWLVYKPDIVCPSALFNYSIGLIFPVLRLTIKLTLLTAHAKSAHPHLRSSLPLHNSLQFDDMPPFPSLR